MNTHYLELLNFLDELKRYPERIMDTTPVFILSEKKLHTERKLNHRERHKFIYDKLLATEKH